MVIQSENPGTLNTWLKSHGGFASGNLFVWDSVKSYGLNYLGKFSNQKDIQSYVSKSDHAVILNVKNGGHWVLATGLSGSTYLVNDPGFSNSAYASSEVT